MKKIYILDLYVSKYVALSEFREEDADRLSHGDKIVYHLNGSDGSTTLSIGTYLWYEIKADRTWSYERILEGNELSFFDEQQQFANEQFAYFKKTFKERFENSKPITARYHIFAHQVYFYFYSEDRYVFGDYVRILREHVGKNIFLFQVGARDMVRLSPSAEVFLTVDWRPLHGSMSWPLPSVPMDNIMLQNLDGRDVERLKWWSGKLKESISYESELYEEEAKKYPARGSAVEAKWGIKGTCLSFNIMNGDVTVKTQESGIMRLPVSQLKIKEYWSKEVSNYSRHRDRDD